MKLSRWAWPLAGLVSGLAGLATSYLVAMVLGVREAPLVAVAELVIRLTPGAMAEAAIQAVGHWDKPLLVGGIVAVLCVVFALAGALVRRVWWVPAVVFGLLVAAGVVAVASQPGPTPAAYLPLAVGYATWLLVLSLLTEPLRRAELAAAPGVEPVHDPGPVSRRGVLMRFGVVALGTLVVAGLGRFIGRGRRRVEETRKLLKLTGITEPAVPGRARIGLEGVSPWQTENDDFYLIHTAIVVPSIEPQDWELRIHGLVEHEIRLSYDELIAREVTETWTTLNCVSNPVGGNLIGNAWWSGVRIADLLREARVRDDADAVLQTSQDGWTCGTPLTPLMDARNAMLAVAMNGEPLPIEHGFPVRTIVPGLYGYVSACKWVVDLEVTRFDRIDAYWTKKGWAEQAPVKLASRIDVPQSGEDVPAGEVRVGGVAWAQHIGIRGVEVAVDGGDWLPAEIAAPPTNDTWVQWAVTVELEPGDHLLRVRATDKNGLVQTGVERDVLPDGATGWHTIDLTAEES